MNDLDAILNTGSEAYRYRLTSTHSLHNWSQSQSRTILKHEHVSTQKRMDGKGIALLDEPYTETYKS